MPFRFERRPPTPALARWVDVVWFARGLVPYERERIAPTGATVALLNLGPAIHHATEGERATRLADPAGFLCGPHDRPSHNEPSGETHAYGVVSTPIGCRALFGLEPRALRGRVLPLESWSAGPPLRSALLGQEPDSGLARLLEGLEAALATPPPRADRVERAVAWLKADPARPVGEIARRLGVSHAHLDREFARVVGLGPRRLASILRLRRLLESLDVSHDVDWAGLAHAHGWYDQSHFVRDFKRYTGVTPRGYVAAQRAHLAPDERAEAGGFVPSGRREVESVQDGTPAEGQDGAGGTS